MQEQQPVSPASGETVNYVASEVVDMDSGMVYLDPNQRAGKMTFEVRAGRMTLQPYQMKEIQDPRAMQQLRVISRKL